MHRYVIRRVLLMILTLFLISIIVFMLIRLIPGNVIDAMMMRARSEGADVTGFNREMLERSLGLDAPIHVQYFRWISDMLLHGNLGESLWEHVSVTTLILSRIAVTFELGLMAVLISIVISLPIGIYSAIRQDTAGDYIGRSTAIIFIAIPGFWIGTLVMVYPSVWWSWSPSVELIHFREDPLGNLWMFFIPSFILGMAMAGGTMRMTRTMMLEVMRQDYIRTAWSKGLKERTVVMRHALKNALIPVVTILGAELPILVGGAVVLEQIFALPGMGKLMVNALDSRDYPVVSAINLIVATAIVFANLVVDISYAYLDPRIRYG